MSPIQPYGARNRRREHKLALWGIALSLLCCIACVSNKSPELTVQESFVVTVNHTLEFEVRASDPEGRALTISVQDLPTGAEFVESEGVGRFSWSPIVSDAPVETSYKLTFSVSDGKNRVEKSVSILVKPEDPLPTLVTPTGYVLDFKRENFITFDIEFKDNDSPDVAISLLSPPAGVQFFQVDTKLARFGWQPSLEQIQARQIYPITVRADDGSNAPVEITILIFLINRPGTTNCQGQPPSLTHTPLANQQDAGPFEIEVKIGEFDSKIQDARLFWTTETPETSTQWNEVPLSPGNIHYTGQIPQIPGGVNMVFYYICATDDDDQLSAVCDHRRCIPEGSYYQFKVSGN